MRKRIVIMTVIVALACLTVYAAFVPPPVISAVSVTGITTTSATVNWSTSVLADSQVAFGVTTSYGSFSALDPTLVRSHSQTLSGLVPYTMYHFQLRSTGSDGRTYLAGDFAFTTTANIVPGMVSNVNASPTSVTTAAITWTTSIPTNSIVDYGLSTNYIPPVSDSSLVTAHSVTLFKLVPGTVYHFRVRSYDAAGNEGISVDSTFTMPLDGSVPVISGVAASFVTSTSANITWSTNIATDSQIQYGLTVSYGDITKLDSTPVITHSQTLTGLTPGSVYHYFVMSRSGNNDPVLSPDFTFATPALSVYIPQFLFAPNQFTGVAFANVGQVPATLNVTSFDGTGSLVLGNNLTNPSITTVGAGGQVATLINQLFGPFTGLWPMGWTAVNSPITTLAGFFLTFDSALSLLDGADLPSSLLDSFLLPQSGSQDFTKIMLSNGSGDAASVGIDLVKTDGTVRSSLQTNINGLATYAADLRTEIFPGVAVDPSDYIRVTSSTGLLPYEYFGNAGKDVAILAGQDSNGGATNLYSPQYAIGGDLKSELSIVNLDATPGTVTFVFKGEDGVQIGATQVMPIAANGKIYVSDGSFFLGSAPTRLLTGYVQVTSSGVRLTGSVVFSEALQGIYTTALPMVSKLQQNLVLSHVASDPTYFTGVAILNPNLADATVQIQLFTASGQLDQSTTLLIPAGHRISRVLTEIFPTLAGQSRTSGYLSISSDQAVASFGVFGTNSLSVMSAIPAQVIR